MWKHKFQKAEILIIAFVILGSFFIISRYRHLADDSWKYNSQPLTNNSTIVGTQILTSSSAANTFPVATTTSNLRFYFFGDLMLDRHIDEILSVKPVSYLFSGFNAENRFWSDADIVGANLEGAVTDSGEHLAPQNAYDFAFKPERIAELKDYGFNYFNSANNHFSDQGQTGVDETRKNLDALGFYHSGSPDAVVDANSEQDVEISGQKVALIGLSMVYKDFDLVKATELINSAHLKSDLVIVNIHWGTEYEHRFSKHQQAIGRALIDAGADAIIGHHPHVVEGLEIYQGKPIFYSLGNFIFDQYFSEDTQEGLSVGLDISQTTTTVFLYPLKSEKAAPRLMTATEKEKFLEKFVDWSQADPILEAEIKSGRLDLENKHNQ